MQPWRVFTVLVHCPWAGTHESGVTGSLAVTLATTLLLFFLSCRQTEIHTHNSAPFFRLRVGVTRQCFEEEHSTVTFRPIRVETVLSVWVMIDSMLDYSQALVTVNLLYVLVPYFVSVNRSVCLTGSRIWWLAGDVWPRKSFKWLIHNDGEQSTSKVNAYIPYHLD